MHSKNSSDRACSRSYGTAHDGTDRASRLTTCLGTVLSTTDCSLSTIGDDQLAATKP